MDDNSSPQRKQAQLIGGKVNKKKQGKDEVDRIKQAAEKKKRRIQKAIASSLAMRAELEEKKQRIKEGYQEADEESWAKKKQEKDELERIKQAEKKKIRLEKALANSAAIRAELEKKKLKKLEEQRRLDEEGAAIAEAAALHVLLGEDDSDDSCQETGIKPWDYTAKLNRHQRCTSPRDCNWSVSYESIARGWDNNNIGVSADLLAAQAVSSLQISENARVDAAVVFNGMFRK